MKLSVLLLSYNYKHYIQQCIDSILSQRTDFDFEIALQLKDDIEKICIAGEYTKKYIDNILEMVHDIRRVESRKEQAEMIKRNYKENSSYAFCILDNKIITNQQWVKLITQKLNYES